MAIEATPQPGDHLTPETTVACAQCGRECFQGVRRAGVLVATCPRHGTFTTGDVAATRVVSGRMNPEERLWVLVTAVATFLSAPESDDFMIVQTSTLGCNYAELRFSGGRLWAEVCSRQWDCPDCGNRPLDAEQRAALSRLGFVGGGPHWNFFRENISGNRPSHALLIERALMAAFNEPFDFEITVLYKRRSAMEELLRRLSPTRRGEAFTELHSHHRQRRAAAPRSRR